MPTNKPGTTGPPPATPRCGTRPAQAASGLWRACEQITVAPVFTVATLRDDLDCSNTATTEAVERLEKTGIVAQVSLADANRVYLNRAVLRLLDDYATCSPTPRGDPAG